MALPWQISKGKTKKMKGKRSNRLKGVTLKTEKGLKKEGRGTSDCQVEESEKLIVVRWYDNRTVDVISSNYIGVNPTNKVQR